MKARLIKFVLAFNLTAFWMILWLLLSSLSQPQAKFSIIPSPPQVQAIFQPAQVHLPTTKIIDSPRPYGMMIGLPTKPQLILSSTLISTFPPASLDYVLWHELGHYQLHHSIILATTWIICLTLGIYLIHHHLRLSSLLTGFLLGIIYIQAGRLTELQADTYAARHMSNPQGMIEAVELFRPYHNHSFPLPPWLDPLLYQQTSHAKKIQIAQQEILFRNNPY